MGKYDLPTSWTEKRLGDIGIFLKGYGISKKDLSDSGTPAIRYGEIYTKYNFVVKNISSYTNSKGTELKKGDILFAGSGETAEEIGKSVAFVDDYKVLAGGDIIIFRPNIDLDSVFLSYMLNFGRCRKDISIMGQGNIIVHIYASELKKLKIYLPPLDEQKRIAEILSTFDDAIENLTKLISVKELYKKGVAQRLLSGKVRFEGFNDEWKEVELKLILKEYTTLNTTGFKQYTIGKNGIKELNDFRHKIDKHKVFKRNDLIVGIGIDEINVNINFDYGCCSPIYKVYSINTDLLNPVFAYFYIRKAVERIKDKITKKSTRRAFEFVHKEFIKYSIILPSIEEQEKIGEALSLLDAEIDNLKKRLELRKLQKKGLMQRLLTGEIRV